MGCTAAMNNYMRPLLFRYRLAVGGLKFILNLIPLTLYWQKLKFCEKYFPFIYLLFLFNERFFAGDN